MAIRKFNPTSPGTRFQTVPTFDEITSNTPHKGLVEPMPSTGGRNIVLGGMSVARRDIPATCLPGVAVLTYYHPEMQDILLQAAEDAGAEVRRGARVTGVDFSPTMIAEARRRAAARGVLARCRFLVQDLAHLDAGEKFDLVLGVTVLQHILEPQALRAAVRRLADHLSEAGRLVLLEAAPDRSLGSCDSPIFQARPRSDYLRLFAECGLTLRAIRGVDPAPFKIWLWPHLPRLAPPVRTAALILATALSIPIDVLFGRRAVGRSISRASSTATGAVTDLMPIERTIVRENPSAFARATAVSSVPRAPAISPARAGTMFATRSCRFL